MKILENIKKGLLQGFGFLLLIGVVGVAYATYTNVNTGDTFTATMWNNRHAPDYDSGWVAAQTNTSNTLTFTHGLGAIPSNVVLLVSPDNTDTWARSTPLNSMALSNSSPENTNITSTQIKLFMYAPDPFLYCDVNNPCESGNTIESGYIKVLAWK